jgi:manganese-dependent ADP-ribose/CDP-alcohol diphosphatase
LVCNLGDIIDGKCQAIEDHGGDMLPEGTDPGHKAIDDVLEALSIYKEGPILSTYGNHELYNLPRHELAHKLQIPFVQEPCGNLVGYRSYSHDGIRFVILDTYDIGVLDRTPDSGKRQRAEALLRQKNPNFPHLENSPEGLTGLSKRFVAFNGGIDELQLQWLEQTLQKARQEDERVIVLSHQPILPGSSSPVCLVWNYKDVLKILRNYSDIVVASLAGHAHRGGYKRDEKSGIHFRVMEAVLESNHPHKTYGMVDIYNDRMVIRGYGNCTSAEYDFDHTMTTTRRQARDGARIKAGAA